MKLSLGVIFSLQVLLLVGASNKDDYLNPDADEKAKIDELRGLVSLRIINVYMKDDDYLLRFLRDQDMFVPRAQEMFLKMIKWRETNKMETILTEDNEDFTKFDTEFRGYIEGCDLGGRPILSTKAADGDVAKEVAAGKEVVLKRYSLKLLEQASSMLRRMKGDGQNVSQVTVLVDLQGFSLDAHACLRCIPIYLNLLDQFQSNYPGYIHRIVVINTPKYAIPIWNTYKISANPALRETVKIFGNNGAEWKNYLKGEISSAEITPHYGGTRPKPLALFDLYKSNKVFKCGAPHSEYGVKE